MQCKCKITKSRYIICSTLSDYAFVDIGISMQYASVKCSAFKSLEHIASDGKLIVILLKNHTGGACVITVCMTLSNAQS